MPDPSCRDRASGVRTRRRGRNRAVCRHRAARGDRPALPHRPARRHHRAHAHRREQPDLPVRLARRDAPGQEVRGRADAAGNRRQQRDPRVLHVQLRHRSGRRRHAGRRRQLDHGLRASRPRLPGRKPHRVRQQRAAGRPRARGRLRDPRRVHRRAPVLPYRRAQHHRHGHGRAAGHSAVRHGVGQFGAARTASTPRGSSGAASRRRPSPG